jgi:hypothetical protein
MLAEPHTLPLPVVVAVEHAEELRQSVALGDSVPVDVPHCEGEAVAQPLCDNVGDPLGEPLALPL